MEKEVCSDGAKSLDLVGEGRDELYYSLELRINQSRIIALMVG